MKKILFALSIISAPMIFGQTNGVGIGTTSPQATLDIVANTNNNAMPDAILTPRLSRAQLILKDAAYGANQNGALVFVNDVTGGTSAKTTDVTKTGFYYYDNATTKWVAVGGATGVSANLYTENGTLTSARTVNQDNKDLTFTTGTAKAVVNGNFQTTGAVYAKNRTITTAPTVGDWLADDYILNIQVSGAQNIALPAPTGANVGRIIVVKNSSTVAGAAGVYTIATNTPLSNPTIAAQRGVMYVSDGTQWISIAGF